LESGAKDRLDVTRRDSKGAAPVLRAQRTDKHCSLGSLAARCGWAKCGSPAGPSLTPPELLA